MITKTSSCVTAVQEDSTKGGVTGGPRDTKNRKS